jgi:hypothetical protein
MRGHGCHVITDSGHDRAPPPAGQGILRTAAYPLVVVSLAESPEYGPRAKFNANAGCHAKGDSGSLDLTPMTKPPLCAARGFTRCTRTDHLHLPGLGQVQMTTSRRSGPASYRRVKDTTYRCPLQIRSAFRHAECPTYSLRREITH